MSKADQNYNSKATDSLLNFETVKYFNAELHEEHRFNKALQFYQAKSIALATSLATLKISKDSVIACSLGLSLALAYYWFSLGRLSIGGFVMFNSYNL